MIHVRDHYSGDWAAAVAAAVAAAGVAGGGTVAFPRDATITLAAAVVLPGNTTLLIPASCTIVKASGAYSHIFGLAVPAYPAYTQNVHIVGGTWRWDTATDPGSNDERGFVQFKYGQGCSVRGGTFYGQNQTWTARQTSGVSLSFCRDSSVSSATMTDTWQGVAITANTAPDNTGRVSDGCSVRGVTVTRAGTPTSYPSVGIQIQGSTGLTPEHVVTDVTVGRVTISGAAMGVEFKKASGCTLKSSTVTNMMMGLSATGAPDTVCEHNTFASSPGAAPFDLSVEITGSPRSRVVGNSFTHLAVKGVGVGAYASTGLNSDDSWVGGNTINGAEDGIQLISGTSRCRASGNTITGCTHGIKVGPTGSVGAATGDTLGNEVAANAIDGCVTGVRVKRDGDHTARNLRVSGNTISATTPILIDGGAPPPGYVVRESV